MLARSPRPAGLLRWRRLVYRKPSPFPPEPPPAIAVADDHMYGTRPIDTATSPAGAVQMVETFRHLEVRLHRYLLALTGSEEDASDLVMDVGTKALRFGHSVDNPERWLWRVARNTAYRYLKRRQRNEAIGQALADGLRSVRRVDPDARRDVHTVLLTLSQDDREILVLHGCLGFELVEIAVLLGISSEAVWKRWQRARDRFAAALRAAGITSANMDG